MKKNIYLVIDQEFDAADELIKFEIPVAFGEREKAIDYIRSIEIPSADGVEIDYLYLDESSCRRGITYMYGHIRTIRIIKVEMKF